MIFIEHDLEMAVLQQLHAAAVVHSSHVYRPFEDDGKGNVHSHHDMHTVVVIFTEQLGQHLAVCFINIPQKMLRIRNLIHRRVDSLLLIAVIVQRVTINGLSNFI